MPEQEVATDENAHGLMHLARQHPALSVLGAAGLGLIGGVELAAGVLIGAGVVAILRRMPGTSMRDRARSIVDRAPDGLKERARAILHAARGRATAAPDAAPGSVPTP